MNTDSSIEIQKSNIYLTFTLMLGERGKTVNQNLCIFLYIKFEIFVRGWILDLVYSIGQKQLNTFY